MQSVNISVKNAGKKYNKSWIFRDFSYDFKKGNTYAILGSNGSGKSTLLKCIMELENLTNGQINYTNSDSKSIDKNLIYKSLTYCAPAQEIIEEFTVKEFLTFHFQFKKLWNASSIEDIIDILELRSHIELPIRDYSSGMKQRVKLAQCFFSDTPIMCLDEPTSNLDEKWIAFYDDYIKKTSPDRLVFIASNQAIEYKRAQVTIQIHDYKTSY